MISQILLKFYMFIIFFDYVPAVRLEMTVLAKSIF